MLSIEKNDNNAKDSQPNVSNLAQIKELGTPAEQSPIYVVSIIGQIEGHINLPAQNKATKYEHVLPQLVAIEQTKSIDGFILLINTVGGDVEAGLALAEMVAGMSKPCVSLILGGGHSIGLTLAVSAKHSFISPSASMTVHPIRMSGVIIGVPQTFDFFNKMQQRIIDFVCAHSKISPQNYRHLMMQTGEMANDCGTVLVGKEAVECGLINQVGGFKEAMEKIKELAAKS